MAELSIKTMGAGRALVMLHGWGMHGGIWGSITTRLAQQFQLHIVDLPGHGRSSLEGEFTLDRVVERLAASLPEEAIWLGWSLGGRIAMAAAVAGVPISRLILVGANPCFTKREGWSHGMDDELLGQFAEQLRDDCRATLLRFLVLQSRGSEQGREEMRTLRGELFSRGEPTPAALAGGLEVLRHADLRADLSRINQPTLVIQGENDTLAPLGAGEYTCSEIPTAQLSVIAGAGHAPFLSHPDAFIAAIKEFLSD
ncbi:pimeloyl-ACP methyl ester esterase BioH [Candidatus Reidiella endopervernicosa]|nr:pimeloyl-ACP methyl ester esterase BioH [Candidatus Reidiella endopervernicosa]QKQ25717.1 pimeloyl-ACP methyl ester esterase BioH [Candidatus Reidiella endopervernicosa]